MKAYICEKYGPPEVLQLREVDRPVPGDHEILIRVHATTVNAADCNVRGLTYIPSGLGFLAKLMLGFSKPKISIPGSVLAGEVEAVGKEVSSLKPGARVYGTGPEMGAYAEYACRPENGALARIPDSISYEEAAVVPYGALTALYFLRDKAGVKKGMKVLIHGASGGVGSYAVQLAHYFGAEVTGVCSTANLEFVRSLGADHVIDYTQEDFRSRNETWDVIMDIVVGRTSFSKCKKVLSPKGYYLAVAGGVNDMLQMIRTSITGGRKVVFGGGSSCEKKENLDFLSDLMLRGDLKPVQDRSFPFEQMVEAHRYVEGGHKKGNICVQIVQS
jgi:NADPH:quinone reductase-like Zn-dependent oxidoreductase